MTESSALFRLDRRWLAALLFVGVASTGLSPSADGDIWWHLAAGREMVARGGLLFSDPFSVGAGGRAWTDVHWLFQLLAFGVHSYGGLAGLVLMKCAALGVGALLLLSGLERERFAAWGRPLFVTLLIAALFAARSLVLVRPVLVTLVCLGLFFRQLECFRRDGRRHHLYWLLPAQVVWANCQGLSALGPAVVAAHALATGCDAWLGARPSWPFARETPRAVAPGRRLKALLVALVASVVGSMLTPFGLRGLSLSAMLFERLLPAEHNVYAHTVAENVPPFLLERWSGELWHFKWFLILFGVCLLAGGRRLRMSHALLVVGFAGLALLANRNVLLFYWVAAPICALQLAPAARRLARRWPGQRGVRRVWSLNAAALAMLLSGSGLAAVRESSLAEPSPFRVPAESVRRLASLPSADVFSADHHGGYLIWQLYPRFRPFIDTRLVLRTPQEFADYLALADFPERFASFQERHHFGYVLLPVAFPERYLGLVAYLYHSPDWKLLFTNGSEVLFARRDLVRTSGWDLAAPSTTDRIVRELEAKLGSEPKVLAAAREHLAMLDVAVGEAAQAERALYGVEGSNAEGLRARCRFAAGDLEAAELAAQRLLAREHDDTQSLSLLARIALLRGDATRGLAFIKRALRENPFDAEASALLANLQEENP
jgi:hypothetical protein